MQIFISEEYAGVEVGQLKFSKFAEKKKEKQESKKYVLFVKWQRLMRDPSLQKFLCNLQQSYSNEQEMLAFAEYSGNIFIINNLKKSSCPAWLGYLVVCIQPCDFFQGKC